MTKPELLKMVEDMGDEIDIDELMYRLYVRTKIERALAAIQAGDVLTHEEVSRQIDEWCR